MRSIILRRSVLACLLVLGCSETAGRQSTESDDVGGSQTHPYGVPVVTVFVQEHMENVVASPGEYRPSTLCEQAYYADGGAGFYHVDAVVGVAEEPLEGGTVEGWTYVELTRLEDWSGTAPDSLILRLSGGPTGPDSFRSVSVKFLEGDEVGLLIKGAELNQNAGFPSTEADWVWRPYDEDLIQGEVGARLAHDELAERFRATYDALPDVDHPLTHECPVQIPWEDCPPDSLWPDDAPRDFDAPEECPTYPEVEQSEPLPADREPDAG